MVKAKYFLFLFVSFLLSTCFADAQNLKDTTVADSTRFNLQDSIGDQKINEITIKGERPLVRAGEGKLTYDMPQIIKGKVVSNAYEAILQLPGIREQDNTLVLSGAGNVSLILDGKPTTMTGDEVITLLKSMPKERIEKAEIMYSAPAQYHIRGAAINLILKKNKSLSPSLQGQIYGTYAQRFYDNQNGGLNLQYSTQKLSMNFMYALSHSQQRSVMNLYSNHFYQDSVYNIDQRNSDKKMSTRHDFNASLDYNISPQSNLNLSYTAQINKDDNRDLSSGNFSNSTSRTYNTDPIQMHNLSLNYNLLKNTKLGADYTYYLNKNEQNFHNVDNNNLSTAFLTDSKQEINKIALYADQTIPLKSSKTQINFGGKFNYANDKNAQIYHSIEGNDLSNLDFHSNINESAYDLYAGLNSSIGEKLSFSASLTGEYYKIGNYSKYSLFPSFEINYSPNPNNIWQLSFSSDKKYPDYWTLNGSTTYLNAYAEVIGNPSLKPSDTYTLNLNYILKGKYVFTLYMNNSNNYFAQTPYQASDALKLIYKTVNYNFNDRYGLSGVIPFSLGKTIHSTFIVDGFYNQSKCDPFFDQSFDNHTFAFYTKLDNTINLSSRPDIKLQLSGQFIKPNIQGPMILSNMWGIDSGIKWSFDRNNAELRLKGTDLFNKWSTNPYLKYADQDLRMSFIPDSREIFLSFTYKFGNYKEKDVKKVDTSRFGH